MIAKMSFNNPHSFTSLSGVPVSYVDQYFGIWCMEPQRFQLHVDRMQGLNVQAHVASRPGPTDSSGDYDYAVIGDGVAVVNLRGPLMKFTSSLMGGSSTVIARRQVRAALADDEVRAILLMIDSPGGTVAGAMDLAIEVAKAAAKKPVHAFVEDLAASAAYWVASQATKVFANANTALVGSIGTYAVLHDTSQAADKLGVKIHVVKAGEFKGMGQPGTEITQAHLDDTQRIVDALNAQFLNGVAQGRKLSAANVKALADGRIHPAADAVQLRLIDAVQSFDRTVIDLGNLSKS